LITVSAVRLPIVEGKLPLRLLQHSPKRVRASKLPMLGGTLPMRFISCTSKATTRVAPPTVAHETPDHEPLQGSKGSESETHQLVSFVLTLAVC
jgi:hypothetical protein